MMKKIIQTVRNLPGHWVGDGFPVRTLFSYNSPDVEISPFLMLDHAGPAEFAPAQRARGVGQHPHRGFETVTIIYDGAVEHRDTAGNSGKIGPGDVQWMTAARGVLHEEMHSQEFTRNGGRLEMVQLWVNLPARYKMSEPRYQEILKASIPEITLGNDAGTVRIIAGEFYDNKGAASTFTPINLWDVRLNPERHVNIELVDGYSTAVLVLHGSVTFNNSESVSAGELLHFEPTGSEITLEASEPATLLVMNGEPIDEPIAGYGPFVMNSQDEIRQAIIDFQSGKFV